MPLGLWLASWAAAGQFYLEGPYIADRADAVRQQSDVVGAGQPGKVVRRFVDGEGWRFLVRVEGFADEASALAAATGIASELGLGLDVLFTNGQGAMFVQRVDPGALGEATPGPGAGAVADADQDEEAVDSVQLEARQRGWAILDRATDAHGIDRDTLTQWMEGPSQLVYRRTLPDGMVVEHTWATRNGMTLVDVAPVQGQGRPSRLFINDRGAWLSVGGGQWAAQDPERARIVAADLGPAAVVPLVFALGQAMETRREFTRIQHAGEGEVGGEANLRAWVWGRPGVCTIGVGGGGVGRPDPTCLLLRGRSDPRVQRLQVGWQACFAASRVECTGGRRRGYRRGAFEWDRTFDLGRWLLAQQATKDPLTRADGPHKDRHGLRYRGLLCWRSSIGRAADL